MSRWSKLILLITIVMSSFVFVSFLYAESLISEECCEVEFTTEQMLADKDFVKKVKVGKNLYQKHCLKCHGKHGDGKGPLIKGFSNLDLKPANLLKSGKLKKYHILSKHIREGKNKMPSWGNYLKNEDIDKIIKYIRILALKKDHKI